MSELRRKVFANSLILALTTIGTRLLMFILAVLVINRLDEREIGHFGAAFGYAILIAATIDFGMRQLLLRAAASLRAAPDRLDALHRRCSRARRLNWLGLLALGLPLLAALGYEWELIGAIAFFSIYGFFDSAAFQNKFVLRGLHAAHVEAKLTAVGRGTILLLGLSLVWAGGLNVASIGVCFIAGAALENLLAYRAYRDQLAALEEATGAPPKSPVPESLPELYRASAPLGLGIVLHGWSQRMPFVLLPILGTPVGLALYTAAIRIPEAASNLPANVMSALIPAVTGRERSEATRRHVNQALEYMLLAAIVGAGLLALESASLTVMLFKPEIADSMIALAMMAAWLGIVTIGFACGGLLIAFHGERRMMTAAGVGLLVSYAFGCWGARFGLEGVVAALLLGQACWVAPMLAEVSARSGALGWSIIARPLPCAFALQAAWWGAWRLWPGDAMFWLRSGLAMLAVGVVFFALTWPRRDSDFLCGVFGISGRFTGRSGDASAGPRPT